MAKRWVVCNWKMNFGGNEGLSFLTEILNKSSFSSEKDLDVVVCPPYTILKAAAEIIKNSFIKLGGQNCSWADSGAFTGEISPSMLKEIGCYYVILGHSERRSYFHEANQVICQKAESALRSELTPIICIGETEAERLEGRTLAVLEKQLKESLPLNQTNCIIAYEPIWAIGTGRIPSLQEIQEVFSCISSYGLPLLYGGSVNANNIHSFSEIKGIQGVLVGGSSLKQQEFELLIEEVKKWE
jgi:triosephosphate isomerase